MSSSPRISIDAVSAYPLDPTNAYSRLEWTYNVPDTLVVMRSGHGAGALRGQ